MKVMFHLEFPKDIRKFEAEYKRISEGLSARFRLKVDEAIQAVQRSPQGAGHYLQVESTVVRSFRRRNLRGFPFFILYGVGEQSLMFGSLIPSRSDPLTWLSRFDDV